MASYAYPNNPTVPNPTEQQSYSNYGQAPVANYAGYTNQADNQWSQSGGAPFSQPPTSFPNLNPPNTFAGSQPQTNFPTSGDFNNPSASYDSGFNSNYQMKKNDYGQKGGNFNNFRGNNNRNSGPGFNNKGPRGNYGASSGSGSGSAMEEQQDTIFVSGLSEDTTEDDLKNFFGAIGLIKIDKKTRKPKIWVYKDKETGKPKGEVTITYDDPPTASSAISWFNGKELNGNILKVELAQRKNNYLAGAGAGGGGNRGGNQFGGGNRGGGNRDFDKKGGNERSNAGGGGPPREGDWVCESCENNNFAWRDSCNRCKAMKPNSAGGNSSNYGEKRGNDRGNLPYDRRGGGNQTNGSRGDRNDRGSFGGRNNNRNNQDRSFGGRDQRGGRNGGGGPMREQRGDNRRSGPY